MTPPAGDPAAPWIPDGVLAHLREVTRGAAAERAPATLASGRYELIEILGQGGMGTVYLARDRKLDREVALKVLRAGEGAAPAAADSEGSARLLAEARILARLEHPGLVPVHDLGTLPDGRTFYAMKRVLGAGLDRFARERWVDGRAELLRVFERICETVAFAHAHGVIHRDLKPQNVMVGPFGEVLVLDWGLAKLRRVAPAGAPAAAGSAPGAGAGDVLGVGGGGAVAVADGAAAAIRAAADLDTAATGPGVVLGTPGYMAPEQVRGAAAEADERADVFALGAILRFLLTGSPVPPGAPAPRGAAPRPSTPASVPAPPVARVPAPLAAICARAMAAEAAHRYAGAAELAADLGCFLGGRPVGAYPETWLRRGWRLARRHATPLLLLLTYLLVRVLLLWLERRR